MTWLLALAVVAPLAQLQQLGDGRDGALEVSGPLTVNRSTELTANAAAGDPFVLVADATPFEKGSLALLVHSQWRSDGERYRIGEFSLHTVERVVGTRLEFSTPLSRPWRSGESQVVLVPQFTEVTITSSGLLEAPPWTGAGGGVLAFVATGLVRNDGVISASGKGLRGGTTREISQRETGCMADEEPGPRGAERGEGSLIGTFGATFTGRRNADSGGGGGACSYSGGGGGASRGEGGQGGYSVDGRRDVGGLGGLALTGSGLLFGGGGGASNGTFGQGRTGGRGGGAVFVRARSLAGAGRIEADGASGGVAGGQFGASSGAGGAGSVVLELVDEARCTVSAAGGAGGDTAFGQGPGGGGGGGRVLVRAAQVVECPISVSGGRAGLSTGADLGAQPGLPGEATVREVGSQTVPFDSGPGVTLVRLGCGCDGASVLLPWVLLLPRRRRARISA